jgi:hypothetical protein
MPQGVRLDNGIPWGGWYDLPTVFALWLIGLGLDVHFNPPRQPQKNGVIERANGTGQMWVEVGKCDSVAQVQEKIDEIDEIQREYMPSINGRSRMAAFPELRHSGRAYCRRWEEANWSLEKVKEALEGYCPTRKVTRQGRISLYYRQVYIGKEAAGKEVQVRYDAASNMWVISSVEGKPLRAVPAIEVERGAIVNLSMYQDAKAKRRCQDEAE